MPFFQGPPPSSGGDDRAPVDAPAASPANLSLNYAPQRYDFRWEPVEGATHYEILEDLDGAGPAAPVPLEGQASSTEYKYLVSLHSRVNAVYAVRACNSAGCGPSSESVTPDLVKAIGYFKASNTFEYDSFGAAVALSADGETLAVGASFENSNAVGINGDQADGSAYAAGAVYVFTRLDGKWVQQAYVKASNTRMYSQFGYSVALSGNGNTMAVGAQGESSNATGVGGDQSNSASPNSGAVYVFSRQDGVWTQKAYVKASNTDASDLFGSRVALSSDGTVLAVSAEREDSNATGINGNQADNSATSAGAVYVFEKTAESWLQNTYVKASNSQDSDSFGSSLALSANGLTLAVGAINEGSNATGINGDQKNNSATRAGAVYVYARNTDTAWAQQAYVKASNTDGSDQFGLSVALSANGDTLAVGANGESSSATGVNGNQLDNSAAYSGAVYVFSRTDGAWEQQAYIKASNTGASHSFGASISLTLDGRFMAVGAPYETNSEIGLNGNQVAGTMYDAGAVYLYAREKGGSWKQQTYVKATNTGKYDGFGISLAVTKDGANLVVGALGEASNATGINGDAANDSAYRSGSVYVY
ncbi:integrin [Variovorax sp. KBS0712]|uniref:integrin n=1 Tax=Variovorax sp. KBS0712 TaxID=2578111 RepID=UPI00163DD05A|nr:integrin [Variovorax sp. KBS0712]